MLTTDWLVGRDLAAGTLVPVLEDWMPEDEGAIYAVVPSSRLLPAKTRAFIGWVSHRFSPLPPWRLGHGRAQ
jgi:DNA-binding transcriptional LysR family regulator